MLGTYNVTYMYMFSQLVDFEFNDNACVYDMRSKKFVKQYN